jgi:hypothetical protein
MTQQIKQARDDFPDGIDDDTYSTLAMVRWFKDHGKTILDLLDKEIDGGWQPIETAPRDGEWVQLYWTTMPITMYPAIGFNSGDEYGWECVSQTDYGEVIPTHWMPLPKPPAKDE